MAWTQTERMISLTTPLGEDVLLLAGLSGREAISEMFSFHLDLLGEGPPIDFSTIIGQTVTISVAGLNGTPRYINGIVSRFALSGQDHHFRRYQMTVVPWTWKLTRFTDCRIFHNQSVEEVLKAVFSRRGMTSHRFQLTRAYSAMEYCVQYRETDFQFISRLMEEHGIFYFFEHGEASHTMVIADSPTSHQPCPGQEDAGCDLASGGLDEADVITAWRFEQQWRSGQCTLTDYNFTEPTVSLLASEPTIVSVAGNSAFELFVYPGGQTSRAEGADRAKLRMEEQEATHLVASGSSVCRAFTPGYRFNLKHHAQKSMNASYILTSVQHSASAAGTYSEHEEIRYSNEFTCIPASVPFRPGRCTPKPVVRGPQTAVVIGRSADKESNNVGAGGDGEEIWVDKYGRVKVLFPWDRAGACSCWVRVSQGWAGENWGAINIPRVGQEVVVGFLEGDPDRPLITGRVYNPDQDSPYSLPDHGTRTTFKTRSSPGGSHDNYNELRFEDKKGNEQIFIRGEKDHDLRIRHDSREWIGNDRSLIVKNERREKVGGNLHLQVSGSHFEKITGDLHQSVDGNLNQKTAQTISFQAGENLYGKSGENYAHEAGATIHLKAGAAMVLEAGAQLSLKVGSNFIDIGPEGIAIQGAMVMINSGGASAAGCGSSPAAPSAPEDPDEADDGSKGTKLN